MRTVLITGAGQGIGAAIAEKFALNDYAVYLNVRTLTPQVEFHIASLQAKGAVILPIIFDINNEVQTIKALSAIEKIDVLVNNAGILRDNLIPQTSFDDWQTVLQTNFYSAQDLFTRCIPKLKQSDNACIINMASISGVRPRAGQGAYAVAKSMLIEWTQHLATTPPEELKALTAYAISPGPVATEMIKKAPWYKQQSAFDRIPLKRFAEPCEIADLVLSLSRNKMLTNGQNVILDGGFTQTTKTA